jgi:hypothetical protein
MKSRKCELCGKRNGSITCFKTAFHLAVSEGDDDE